MFNRKHSYRFDGTDVTFTATSREVAAYNFIFDTYTSLTRYGIPTDARVGVLKATCPVKFKIARRLVKRLMKDHCLGPLENDEFSSQIIPTF